MEKVQKSAMAKSKYCLQGSSYCGIGSCILCRFTGTKYCWK